MNTEKSPTSGTLGSKGEIVPGPVEGRALSSYLVVIENALVTAIKADRQWGWIAECRIALEDLQRLRIELDKVVAMSEHYQSALRSSETERLQYRALAKARGEKDAG